MDAAHVHPPKMPAADYKSVLYKASSDTGEAASQGRLFRKALIFFFSYVPWAMVYGGAVVLDVLRMKAANAGFFEWQKLAAMWVSLVAYLIYATGVMGAVLAKFLLWLLTLMDVGIFAFHALNAISIFWVNSLYSFCTPTLQARIRLIGQTPILNGKAGVFNFLHTTNLGSVSLLDWYTYVDLASMLIPVGLTLLATVKYLKLPKGVHALGGEECISNAWTPTQHAMLAFAVVLLFLGLPGAPLGLWVLLSLGGWWIYGKTKRPAGLNAEPRLVKSLINLNRAPAPSSSPVPRAPRPPANSAAAHLSGGSLTDFEEHNNPTPPAN